MPVTDRLYNLMPAIYRIRDLDDGQTLRAFMGVLERVFAALQDDMDALYDDWFIETCEERIVPYIADLVGVRQLLDPLHVQGTRRRHVANVTSYRSSTGALRTLQDIAHDLTGWPVEVVDLAGLVAAMQHVQHARPDHTTRVDVRLPNSPSYAPFASVSHSVDVRHIVPDIGHGALHSGSVRRGYNLTDVGVYFWRLQTYPVVESTPFQVDQGRYTFDPSGLDTPLFQPARTPPRSGEQMPYLPVALQLTTRPDPLPFAVWLDETPEPVRSADVALADLSQWSPTQALVTVDTLLGRIACSAERHVRMVSYWYAFSGDIGAGPYWRQKSIEQALARRTINWRAWVGQSLEADPAQQVFHTLADAVQAWNARPAGECGVIAVVDNATYAAPADPILVRDGSFLALVAARQGEPDVLVASMVRPCVNGNLKISGGPAREPGELLVDGILWNGALEAGPADLGRLTLAHTTFVPSRGGLRVEPGNSRLILELNRSICGPLVVLDPTARLEMEHSVVDAAGDVAVEASQCAVALRGSTLFGATRAGSIEASDSLFIGSVHAARRQVGGVEYSFVPHGSRTPPRRDCQPDLALQTSPLDEHGWIRARLVPSFTSTHFGDPGYAQLTASTPSQLRAGARNDAEMGAFHLLYQPLRMTSFINTLREFLPAGRDLGVFLIS